MLQIHVFENIHSRAAFSPENTLQRPCTVVNIYAGSTLGFLCQNRWERIVLTLQVGAVAWEGVFTVYVLVVFFFGNCSESSWNLVSIAWSIQESNKITLYLLSICFAANCRIYIYLPCHFCPAERNGCRINVVPICI